MSIRSKAIAVLTVSLFVLSGCVEQEAAAPVPSPRQTNIIEQSEEPQPVEPEAAEVESDEPEAAEPEAAEVEAAEVESDEKEEAGHNTLKVEESLEVEEPSEIAEDQEEPSEEVEEDWFIGNLNGSARYEGVFTINTSETVHPNFLAEVEHSLAMAIDAIDELVTPPSVQVYLFTINDAVWLQNILNETGTAQYMPAPDAQTYLANSWSEDCGQAFVAGSRFFQCTPLDGSGMNHAPHEYFHLVQNALGQSGKTPVWLTEGMPTYFQEVLNDRGHLCEPISSETIMNNLPQLETLQDRNGVAVQRYKGYRIGNLAIQTLVRNYGYDALIRLNKDVGSASNWQTLLTDIIGKDIGSFYEEVASLCN